MLDFILSKFGIMLFAVAVAGILVMFATEMKNIFVADEGMQLSSVISKQLKEMADSQSLCVFTYVSLPKFIDVIGTTDTPTTTSLYYFIDINVVSANNEDKKFVVFTLINKKTKKPLSLESFITDAEINFIVDSFQKTKMQGENLRIDPTETNVLYMIKISKATDEGIKKIIYFLPCKYSKTNGFENCYSIIKSHSENGGELSLENGAYCIPRGNPNESTQP